MNTTTETSTTRSFLTVLLVGVAAGVLAGIAMLVTMGILRLAFGWPTPTELIFDRLFPFLTVEFFIGSLVKAGGYTPLKLQGIYGALAGQVAVAAIGGVIYSWYLNRLERRRRSDIVNHGFVDARGLRLIVPGVLVATILFIILLWPTLITNYHGLPPARARIIASLEMLISFSVCGFGIMLFHALLSARPAQSSTRKRGCAHGRPEAFPCPGDRRRALHSAWGITAPALPDRHIRVRRPTVQRARRAKDHADSPTG